MESLYSVEIQPMEMTDLPQSAALTESPFQMAGETSNLLTYNVLDGVVVESLNQMIARMDEDSNQDDSLFAGNLPEIQASGTELQQEGGRVELLDVLSMISESQEEMAANLEQELDQPSAAFVVPYVSSSKSETYLSQKRKRKMSAREQVLEEKEILEGEDLSDLYTRDPTVGSRRVVEIQSY